MTNGRYVDIENEVLRGRLKDCKDTVLKLCATVRRYAAPAKDDYCSRSELLRAVAEAEKTAHGMK